MQGNLDFFRAVRRNWPIALVVFAAALTATAVVTAMQKPVYEASAQLVVAPVESQSAAEVVRALETLERRTVVATFARIPSTPEVHREVSSALKIERSRDYRAHGSVVPNTNIIRIEAEGPDPKKTAALANAVAAATAKRAEALYRVYALRLLAEAPTPRDPAYPDRRRNYLVGAAFGVFAGLVSVLAAERIRGSTP